MEMIVVDTSAGGDGKSPAQAFTKRDRRVTYVALPGIGEANARKRAVAETAAKHIMFVMAGDVVEKSGLEVMLASLKESGSSFAVGTAGIVRGKSSRIPTWQREIHSQAWPSATLSDIPEILADGMLANKLFNREFWLSATSEISVDRYHWQYQAVATLYSRATAFDILDFKVINTSSDESVRPPQRELLCQMQYLEDRLRRLESMATEVRWDCHP